MLKVISGYTMKYRIYFVRNTVEGCKPTMGIRGDLWSTTIRRERISDSFEKYKAIYVHKRVDEGENDRRCAIKET